MKKIIQQLLKFLPLGLAMIFLAFLWIGVAQGSQITNNPSSLNLGTVSSTNGNFTYTTTTVLSVTNTSTFEGFTQLGELAPPEKVFFATGTTANAQCSGSYIELDPSISVDKITSVNVMVNWSGNSPISNSYFYSSGYQYSWYISDGLTPERLYVNNDCGASAFITSVPFRVRITYTF